MTAWTDTLPPHLAERFIPLNDRGVNPHGEFILYWMRTAVRGHENPALDTALVLSRTIDRPVIVYHQITERYAYASDRFHAFILQGARDAAAELKERGVAFFSHVERPGHRGKPLEALASRAAAIVTEAMPTAPVRQEAVALAGAVSVAMAEVDTACLLPMPLVGKCFTRAFAFRKATEKKRHPRIEPPWIDQDADHAPYFPTNLPFEPVDLETADLAALIGMAEIDHSVGPVADTPGGAVAGYARWEAFRDKRLAHYARRRNDATDRDAVSRLSAHLHFGHVSPFRIAREAAAIGGEGASKYLDELLVWRELAYTWCAQTPDHERIDSLPRWAAESLQDAEEDERPYLLSWEEMARAKSGDPLWDAAQASLLIHGELHNNLRMTWGKAILTWTPDAETALERLIDLNHRYALDGRDPNSYGGLLWCLGQFDRAFEPPSPIFGAVRPRYTTQHAERLDLDRFQTRVHGPNRPDTPSIAVIGAGMAGLMAARTLSDHGFQVTVYDKGRGVGGRLSTRRSDFGSFDHGANYLTARDPRLRRLVDSWREAGLVARWQAPIMARTADRWQDIPVTERFVGVPTMSAVAKHLAADLPVETGVRIAQIKKGATGFDLITDDGVHVDPVDRVIVAVPPVQAAPLVEADPVLLAATQKAEIAPCWTVMLAFDTPVQAPAGCLFDQRNQAIIGWANRMTAKPGRDGGERWVLQAKADWSRDHEEETQDWILKAIIPAFRALLGVDIPHPIHATAHRWRYALTDQAVGIPALAGETGLLLAGDWLAGGTIEAAALSGQAAAGHILRQTAFKSGFQDTALTAEEPRSVDPLAAAAQ